MRIWKLATVTVVIFFGGCVEHPVPVATPMQDQERVRFLDDPFRFRVDIERRGLGPTSPDGRVVGTG